jgi:hypothetical protein
METMILQLEQLPDRTCPSLFSSVNDAWTHLPLGLRHQTPLTESIALDRVASRMAFEVAVGKRAPGPQSDYLSGWWSGGEVSASVPQLVTGRALVRGSPLSAGVGQSGKWLVLVTGTPTREGAAMPPVSSKGTML